MLECIFENKLISLLVFALIVFLYKIVIQPYSLMKYYEKKGIIISYFPIFGGYIINMMKDVKTHKDMYYGLKRMSEKIKKIGFATNLYSKVFIYITDTEYLKEILNHPENYQKDFTLVEHVRKIVGNGLVFSEGEVWKQQRKCMSNLFNFNFIKSHIPRFNELINDELNKYDRKIGYEINMSELVAELGGQVNVNIFLGEHGEKQKIWNMSLSNAISWIFEEMTNLTQSLQHLVFGISYIHLNYSSRLRRVTSRLKELKSFVKDLIKKEVEIFEDQRILEKEYSLKNIVYYMKKDGFLENFQQLDNMANIVLNFQIAGKDTTAKLLEMTFYYVFFECLQVIQIAKYPDIQKRVQQEIKHLEGKENLEFDDIKTLDYLEKLFKEVLRVFGPGNAIFPREVVKDIKIKGLLVKKGTVILPFFLPNYYNPDYFVDPFKFDPDRWDEDKISDPVRNNPYIYIPFSAGPRNCMGQHLAMITSKLILIKCMQKFKKFSLVDEDKFAFVVRFQYEPNQPIKIKLE